MPVLGYFHRPPDLEERGFLFLSAYYNENGPFAAAWLRELIKVGHIAPGEVDERSIEDVKPTDLMGYNQCHFFGGIGGWSYALRLAGWPDDEPVWTGSCPCPSFSAAGKGEGFNDPRHLWPAWFRLIEECCPPVIFGEQVAAAIGHGWLDLVQSDLEAQDYALGKAVLGACSIGAPHIRQRLYFVAESEQWAAERHGFKLGAASSRVQREAFQRERIRNDAGNGDPVDQLGVTLPIGLGGSNKIPASIRKGSSAQQEGRSQSGRWAKCATGPAGPTNGFWRDAEWIPCRDGKARAAKPGILPLAPGLPGRVGLLRGAGNSIVPQVAQAFIEAYLDTKTQLPAPG